MNANIHKGTNKKIFINSVVLYIRLFIVLFLSLFSTRFVLEGLGQDNFGLYNLIAGIVSLFGFVSGTLAGATQRFISFEIGATQNIERVNKVFNTSIRLHFIAATIILAVIISGGILLINNVLTIPAESKTSAIIILICVGSGFAITILGVPFEAVLMAHENITYVAIIQIGSTLLRFLSALMTIWLIKYKLETYAVMMAFISLILSFSEFIYAKKNYPETKHSKVSLRNNPIRKEIQSFAAFSLLGSMGWAIRSQGISIILNIFWGVAVNAANGIANQVNGALLSLSSSMTTSIRPQLIQCAGEKDFKRMITLACSASKYPIMILSLLSIPIFIGMPLILKLWLTSVPQHTITFCRFLVIELILNQSSYGMALILDALGNIKKLHLIVGGSLIFTTICAYFIGMIFKNPDYIYWCIVINAFLIGIIRITLVAKQINKLSATVDILKILFNNIIKPIFTIAIIFFIINCIWHFLPQDIGGFIYMFMISFCICTIVFYSFILNRNERNKLVMSIHKVTNKIFKR